MRDHEPTNTKVMDATSQAVGIAASHRRDHARGDVFCLCGQFVPTRSDMRDHKRAIINAETVRILRSSLR